MSQKGIERLIETRLTEDGQTFVLVNEEIEAEINEDKWWARNQSMLQLECRDGSVVPCRPRKRCVKLKRTGNESLVEDITKRSCLVKV
ncbi:hypothetical protein WAI453_010557 [Rhynchosporium graminicola]